jgi:MYXO-CTERM domain-containing protein
MSTKMQPTLSRSRTAIAIGIALFSLSTVSIAAVTERPAIGLDDTATITGTDAIAIPVLDNDGEVDPATLSLLAAPSKGTVTKTGNTLTYTPSADFSGTDTFTYTITEKEWRKNAAGEFKFETFDLVDINSKAPITSTYPNPSDAANPVTIYDGEQPAMGFWNESPKDPAAGVVGKSYKPNDTTMEIGSCAQGADSALIKLAMTWKAERYPVAGGNVGGNMFTITSSKTPSPDETTSQALVLKVNKNDTTSIRLNGSDYTTTSNTGISDSSGKWEFTATANWAEMTAAEFAAMDVTVLASVYNNKTWYNNATAFQATADYSLCTLATKTVTVTVNASTEPTTPDTDDDDDSGGSGSLGGLSLLLIAAFGMGRRRLS